MTPDDHPHDLTRYKCGPDEHGIPGKGCRCTRCRAANRAWKANRARMVAYGLWQPYVDAAGTRRRIQALIYNGQSMGVLARRLGCQRREVRELLFTRRHVTPQTAEKIRALCRGLWDQPPPGETPREKQAAVKARRYARERGFVPLLAWDAIDDPDAVPVEGWERGEGREWGTLAAEALDLLSLGLDVQQAAERLGVSRSTLSTTLSRVRVKEAERAA